MEVALLKFDVTKLPIMNVNMRVIPVYKKVMERVQRVKGDADGRRKMQNIKEMAFIHLYTAFMLDEDNVNPYHKYAPEEKYTKLVRDLDMPEGWSIDKDLQEAIDLYSERVVKTFDMEMLDAAEHAARQTVVYLRNVDYDRRDIKGNLLYTPKIVMSTIADIDGLLSDLAKVRERIIKNEKKNVSKVRGGGEVGSREVPKRDVR